jgi:hypothetical protein
MGRKGGFSYLQREGRAGSHLYRETEGRVLIFAEGRKGGFLSLQRGGRYIIVFIFTKKRYISYFFI